MKKITLMLGAFAMMAMVSCKKDVPPPPPPPEVPAELPAPPPPPAPEVPPAVDEKDGTSVEVGKDGINVTTKNGTKSTEVKVDSKGTKVETKKP
ncbi:MAG: hypothetical protein PSV16_06940 [Flavobacterium sp.]|nr:hypothetical protein [Flavobacterium sp.]